MSEEQAVELSPDSIRTNSEQLEESAEVASTSNDTSSGLVEDNDDKNMFASVWVKCELDMPEDDTAGDATKASKTTSRPRTRQAYKKRPIKPKTLLCDQCDYKTSYKNCLNIHILGHTDAKPLTCDRCDYKTRYPASLKRHIFLKHDCEEDETKKEELPCFKCNVCTYTTPYKCNLSSHKRKHEIIKHFKCPHCNYATAYKHNYAKHSRTHEKPAERTYFCDKCPFVAKHQGHITRHLAKVHLEVSEKAAKCEQCTFSTKIKWRLNLHMTRSRQETPITCTHCEYVSIYRCAYREHKKVHNGGTQRNSWLTSLFTKHAIVQAQNLQDGYENTIDEQSKEIMKMCEIRSKIDEGSNQNGIKIYNELKSLLSVDPIYYTMNDTHPKMDIHSYPLHAITQQSEHEKNYHYYVDPTCDVQWGSIRVIESSDLDRPFQCIACDHRAKFKASIQRHYQRHHSENRPYKCVNCDFSTKTKDKITVHSKRSKSDVVLSCKICGYTSIFRCQFSMHEKAHNPLKCVYCDYSCKNKSDMQKHFTMVHLGNELKDLILNH